MEDNKLRTGVMEAIKKGEVKMRPRWHFALITALTVIGAGIIFLTLLYIASLAFFLLRDSGAWFAPGFGARGWWVFLLEVPWFLVLLVILFVFILQLLVRHFAFVYHKPLLASAVAVVAVIFVVGLLIAQTPFHRSLMISAREGALPLPLNLGYRAPFRMPRPSDSYHGDIVAMTGNGFIIVDEDGAGTTTVVITPHTLLPSGADFSPGERVMVVGDSIGTSTVQAFGIQEIDEYQGDEVPALPMK